LKTIQDVAQRAGVSVSTVSNVLNGRTDRMRPETLARVQEAIASLQFRPNKLARHLKTGDTPLLGLLVPSIANPMYGYIAREVETYAQERYGLRVLIGNTYRDKDKEASFFDDLLAQGVRRVLVISSLADEQHLENAARHGMAVVSYDRRATPGVDSLIDHVTPDNYEAARMATALLIEHGHKRVAFATVAGMTMSRSAKISGFMDAAAAAGIGQGAQMLEGGQPTEYGDSVVSEVGRLLGARIGRDPQRPTGIVAVNDLMALGLMAGLRDAGLRVPEDVSVIGIDGLFLAALSNPALTTVALPVPDMARAMVERVMDRSSDSQAACREMVFAPTRVMPGGSVASPPGASNPLSTRSRTKGKAQ
jgi:DNA-binding LacI/PurR family transcriptional regulator